MKKLFLLAFAMMLCIACSTEEEITTNEDTNLEVVLENYKGIFTTTDGQNRGALDVTLSENGRSASGSLTLATGEVITIFTDQVTDLGNIKEMTFTSTDLSFTMTTGEEGETVDIGTVIFRGLESSILAGRSTERAPLSPIVGSYTCPMCPVPLDNTAVETFNLLVSPADMSGNSTIASQTTLAGTIYNGVATQSGCVVNGSQTTCNLNSGTVTGVTGVAFNPGGGDVTWSGMHTFDNGPSSGNDCSTVSGTWQWVSSTIGTVGGALISNNSGDCPLPLTELIFEDFEDSTVGYIVRDESNGVDRGENTSDSMATSGGDYIGRVSASNFPAGEFQLINVQGSSVFGAGDVDGTPSPWLTSSDNASVRWDNVNVSGLSTLTVSALIAERREAGSPTPFDIRAGAGMSIEVSYNGGTSWVPIFAAVGPQPGNAQTNAQVDANLDGVGDGAFIDDTLTEYSATAPTNGNTTMSVRFFFLDLDAGHEDFAIDNVTISGN